VILKSLSSYIQSHSACCFVSAIVQGDTPDDVYAKVKEVIRVQSGPVVWVPSNEKL